MREETSESITTVCDDVAIVMVTGELDLAICIKLAPKLDAAGRSAVRAVVIDFEMSPWGTPRGSRC